MIQQLENIIDKVKEMYKPKDVEPLYVGSCDYETIKRIYENNNQTRTN